MNSGQAVRSLSRSDILCVLGMILCSLAGIAPVTKYVHGGALALFAVAVVVGVAALMFWLRLRHLSGRGELKARWLALLWCAFALLFLVLFPLANGHTLGAGSDRADALRISASALIHGHYPYRAETYLGNPITPLPGAILLAVPFLLLGNVSIQNLLWLALFLLFSQWFFRSRATAIVYVLLLGASAINLDDFVVGGDFLVNAMYVCVAIALVMTTHERDRAVWMRIAAGVFLGLAVDSRPVCAVVAPLLVAYVLQRRGRGAALGLLLISGGVAALLSVPFYLYDPAHFSPLHIRDELDFFPAWLHADWALAALGVLTSCAGFFVRLNRKRVFLLTGASLLVMFGPPAVMGWSVDGFTMWGWFDLALTSLPALFFSLWILAKYEETGLSFRSGMKRPAMHAAVSP